MKKILIATFFVFAVLTLASFASMNLSISEDGTSIDLNLHRKGNLIYLKYKMNGLDNENIKESLTSEQLEKLEGVSNMDIDMVLDCSTQQVRINSMGLNEERVNFLQHQQSEDAWVQITKSDQVEKFVELCDKILE